MFVTGDTFKKGVIDAGTGGFIARSGTGGFLTVNFSKGRRLQPAS